MTIVVCYAPTDVAEAEEKDQFYQSFEDVLQRAHAHDLQVVIGDFNARVGNVRNGFELFLGPHALPGPVNDNGQRLLDTCASNNLVIGGSLFPHRLIHKYTWTSSAGTRPRAQLDHVLINRWWRRSLLDCRTYRGADIGSDHELVVAKLRLKLASVNRPKATRRLDVEKLRDEIYLKEYREEVTRRFTGIDMAHCSVEEGWQSWRDAVKGAAENTIGPRKKRHRPWISKTTKSLVLERQKAKVAKDQLASRSRCEKYRTLERQVKDSARNDKQKWMDTRSVEMETAAQRGEHRQLYQLVKQLSGKFPADTPPVKEDDGTPIEDREQVKARWAGYFQDLLNRPPPQRRLHRLGCIGDLLDLSENPPTRREVEKAIQKLKNNKAPGLDGIVAELIKLAPTEVISSLHQLLLKIWEDEVVPEDWCKGLICTIFKKGDRSICSNYRGISLLSVPGKIFGHIILDRMREGVEKKLRENQGGFRSGRGCADKIFCLRMLIEKCVEFQLPTLAIFVDFKAAFDSIHRPSMWHILTDYGIPAKYIRLIRCIYDNCEAAVLVEGEITDWFRIETGVRQGCVWSPLLFGIMIDFVLRKSCDRPSAGICMRERRRTLFGTEQAWHLTDLDYADDVTLLESGSERGQQALHALQRAGEEVGLAISKSKTKTLGFGETEPVIHLDGEIVEAVNHFRYLGSEVMSSGRLDEELRTRIGRASAAFGQLSKIWRSKISLKTKLRIYNAVVISTLLYGSETWATTNTEEKRLDVFDNRCLRRILGIKWFHRVRNTTVRERTGQTPASLLLKIRRLRWFGHVSRMDQERLPKSLMQWRPENAKRRRGRCRTRWRDAVERDGRLAGLEQDLESMASDKAQWRDMLALLVS